MAATGVGVEPFRAMITMNVMAISSSNDPATTSRNQLGIAHVLLLLLCITHNIQKVEGDFKLTVIFVFCFLFFFSNFNTPSFFLSFLCRDLQTCGSSPSVFFYSISTSPSLRVFVEFNSSNHEQPD